jgi:hypothetical protein
MRVAVVVLIAFTAAAQAPSPAGVSAPVWPKPDLFWFQKPVDGGIVWLKVDAEHGVKEPLFDHQRLAVELNLRTGHEYTPLALPFSDPSAAFVVKYDGSNAYIQEGAMAIEFLLDGQRWRCDLQIKWDWNRVPPTDYECLPRGPAPAPGASRDGPARTDARRSPDGRWDAFTHEYNVVVRSVASPDAPIRRLSSDGTPIAAYHAGSLRWSADSTSLTAFRVDARVWESASLNASVKPLVVKQMWPIR